VKEEGSYWWEKVGLKVRRKLMSYLLKLMTLRKPWRIMFSLNLFNIPTLYFILQDFLGLFPLFAMNLNKMSL
jgi:hypothetical protein